MEDKDWDHVCRMVPAARAAGVEDMGWDHVCRVAPAVRAAGVEDKGWDHVCRTAPAARTARLSGVTGCKPLWALRDPAPGLRGGQEASTMAFHHPDLW